MLRSDQTRSKFLARRGYKQSQHRDANRREFTPGDMNYAMTNSPDVTDVESEMEKIIVAVCGHPELHDTTRDQTKEEIVGGKVSEEMGLHGKF